MSGPSLRIALKTIVFLMLAYARVAGAQVPNIDPNDTGRTFALTVVNEKTGDPLEGVQVKSRYDMGPADRLVTAADGVVNLEFSAKTKQLYVEASLKGFVPMRLYFRSTMQIPESYTLALEPATTISGKVVDDAGQPVEGATVVIYIQSVPNPQRPAEAFNASSATAKTDATGKWSFDGAPTKIQRMSVGAYHMKYVSAASGGYYPLQEVTENPGLRDGSYAITLPRGKAIHGVVLGSDGKPVSGATVGLGSDRVASNVLPELKTNAKGEFDLAAKPGEKVVLTVKGKNQSPKLQAFTMPENDYALTINLEPPKELSGRVVDVNGKPVPGVMVYVDGWQGNRTLSQRMNTDADGRFSWKGAPGDELAVDVLKEGYAEQRGVKMKAGGENQVTLRPPATFHGTVVDAATGEPVKEFKVLKGIDFRQENQPIYWERGRTGRPNDEAQPTGDGKFDCTFAGSYPGYAVRVEAPDYLPADSKPFTLQDGDVEFTFKLQRGKSLAGTVKDPTGKPVEGADVVLATGGGGGAVQISNGTMQEGLSDRYVSTRTGAGGAFTLPPQADRYAIVVLADAGYAKVDRRDFEKSSDVTLQPWCVIEGTVKRGSKVVGGAMVDASAYEEGAMDESTPHVFHSLQASADAEGHFRFDRVPPTKLTVGRRIQLDEHSWTQGSSITVVAKPGETIKVDIGGKGRPITGKVNAPASVDPAGRWDPHATLTDIPAYPFPPNWSTMNNDERSKWVTDFQNSLAGKAFSLFGGGRRTASRFVTVVVSPDGTYHADEVEPGNYQLTLSYSKPMERFQFGGIPLATATVFLTIAPFDGGPIDEPLVVPPVDGKPVETKSATPATRPAKG